ncbi:PREDICTED: single-stranded DNA-binding protein, mitochondrial [Lupinus angustifolius]|uniref:single-stranded DNA-binding protein, mitochondrial n=1 Tax=Lupinus angustifolius TaxID=3871 RepID=UPI00092F999D|nr:PREDICTED: single-stranded DNA-binding protein, mitochondrial [Lupinus angustifolius]
MRSSISNVSSRFYRTVFSHHHFCTTTTATTTATTNFLSHYDSDPDSPPPPPPDSTQQHDQKPFFDRPLENGLDPGIYRAILVGQVGQKPLQKKLRSGLSVTLLSLGTGGIRNNRRPLQNENPTDYANRCSIQWHRVSIYPERLGTLLVKHVVPGSLLYVEGNLETKVFADPVTGLVRRIREIAVRRHGRVVFLNQGGDDEQQTQQNDLRSVGYY